MKDKDKQQLKEQVNEQEQEKDISKQIEKQKEIDKKKDVDKYNQKEKEKEQKKDKEKELEKEKTIEQKKDKEKELVREQKQKQEKEQRKEQGTEKQEKEQKKEKDIDKGKEKEQQKEQQKEQKKELKQKQEKEQRKEQKKELVKEQKKEFEKEKEQEKEQDKHQVEEKEKDKKKEKKKDDINHHKKNKHCNTLSQDAIHQMLATRHMKTRSTVFQSTNLQESFFELTSGAYTDRGEDSFRQFTNPGALTDRNEDSFYLNRNSDTPTFQAFTLRKSYSCEDIQPFNCIDQYLVRLYQLEIQLDQFKEAGFQTVASFELLNELKDMLAQSKKSKRTEDLKMLQLRVCSILNTLLIENPQSVNAVIKTGIIDEVLSIINLILLSQVQISHLLPLHKFFEICSSQQKLLFIDKGIIPTMRRLLDSLDELCVKIAVGIIKRIIHACQELSSLGVQIDIKKIIESDGTLDKLVTVLLNDEYQDQEVNQNASLAIGLTFKAAPLPKEFRNEVILTI
ncbi:MAG: hypothetical protein EZS28_040355, partial [Streblomastix strix]